MTQEKIKPYEGIDLVHMLKYLLKSWYKMLIAMLLFGVLFGGYSYYKNAKAIEAKESAASTQDAQENAMENGAVPTSAEEILDNAGLNEKAADEVLYYTNKYYYNQKQYERQFDYLENSILMQIDPNQVWTVTLCYDLSASGASADKRSDSLLGITYLSQIKSDEVYGQLKETLGVETENCYLAELIEGTVVDNYIDGQMIDDKEEIKIVIQYKDQAGCEAMAEVIKEKMTQSKQTVTTMNGAHTVTLVGESVECKADAGLLNEQRNNINTLGAISDNVVSARNNIEVSEERVFEELVEYYEMNDSDTTDIAKVEEISETENAKEEQVVTEKPGVSKKYVALGLFLGLFLVAAYEGCKYFFSSKLKQASELEKGYGLAVYDQCDQAIIQYVMKDKQVFVTSSASDIAADEKELEKLAEAEYVMLEEKINVSSHKDIAKILEICKRLDKKVLGVIVEA